MLPPSSQGLLNTVSRHRQLYTEMHDAGAQLRMTLTEQLTTQHHSQDEARGRQASASGKLAQKAESSKNESLEKR